MKIPPIDLLRFCSGLCCLATALTLSGQNSSEELLEKLSQQSFRNWDSLEYYASQLLETPDEKEPRLLGVLHQRLGTIQVEKYSNYDSAMQHYDVAMAHATKANDSSTMSAIFNSYGVVYKFRGEYEQALKHFYESLDYRPHESEESITTLNNVGEVLFNLGRPENASEYHDKAFRLATVRQDSFLLGNTHVYLGNLRASEGRYEEAIQHYRRALAHLQPYETSKAPIFGNIGANYFYLGNLEEAIRFYKEGISEAENFGDQRSVAIGLFNLGEAQAAIESPETMSTFDQAIKLAKDLNLKQLVSYGYQFQSDYLERIHQPVEALQAYKLHKLYADSVLNESSQKNINELQIKYQTTQKEMIISEQKSELSARKTQTVILLSVLIILILFGITFYLFLKSRQKSRLQEAVIAEKEKSIRAVFEATETERKRISRDLHDGAGQQLSGIKMALTTFMGKLNKIDPEQTLQSEQIITLLSQASDEIRSISYRMIPRTLEELGLVPAMEDLLCKTFSLTSINYTFEHHQADQRLPEQVEIGLFRVVQELLNNILKHSEAKNVRIQLYRLGHKLTLTVEDDGKGMKDAQFHHGHGLRNIRSRLEMLKGSVHFDSASDTGTLVTASLPVEG